MIAQSLSTLQWFIVILAVMALPLQIAYSVYLSVNKKNWKSSGGTIKEKNEREKQRGTLVSIISASILAIIMTLMTSVWKLDQSIVKFRYGFILGPVIGYMLDRGIGSDIGLQNPFTFAFSSLYNWDFFRYVITVLIDLFISDPILDGLKVFLGPSLQGLSNQQFFLYKLIGENALNIMQGIVGFITFQAYTNQTRFNWAYPPKELPMDQRYKGINIIILTAIASVIYLITDVKGGSSNTTSSKLPVVMFSFAMLSILAQFEKLDAPMCENKDDCNKPHKTSTLAIIIGIVIFILFALYGFVSPFFSKQKITSISTGAVTMGKI